MQLKDQDAGPVLGWDCQPSTLLSGNARHILLVLFTVGVLAMGLLTVNATPGGDVFCMILLC